jgi:hypothetical protein
MLLAVGIVSGVVYNSAGVNFCSESVSGFSGHETGISEFRLTGGHSEMQMILRNDDSQGLTHNVSRVTLRDRDQDEKFRVIPLNQKLEAGESQVVRASGVEKAEICNEFEVEIVFDRGELLSNQKAVGSIKTAARISESSEIPENFEVDFSSVSTSTPRENTSITYEVVNTGKEGTQTVELDIDGSTASSNSFNLDSYESISRTYKHSSQFPGNTQLHNRAKIIHNLQQ